jgi:hypothetical protein
VTLDDLDDAVTGRFGDLEESVDVELDRESRTELAMLLAATDADRDELLRRAVHLLFQTSVETGQLDFQLRTEFDCTYDEYLSGMSYDEMGGQPPATDDGDRRYQF